MGRGPWAWQGFTFFHFSIFQFFTLIKLKFIRRAYEACKWSCQQQNSFVLVYAALPRQRPGGPQKLEKPERVWEIRGVRGVRGVCLLSSQPPKPSGCRFLLSFCRGPKLCIAVCRLRRRLRLRLRLRLLELCWRCKAFWATTMNLHLGACQRAGVADSFRVQQQQQQQPLRR